MKLLIDVDTQFDFMLPEGALYVPGAETIMPALASVLCRANEKQTMIVSTLDIHNGSEPEMAKNGGPFPLHCMAGTKGSIRVTPMGGSNHFMAIKSCYNIWDEKCGKPGLLETILTGTLSGNRPIDEIYVMGVATEYCVKAAVEGFLARQKKVFLITDAIKGLDGHTQALTEMLKNGVTAINAKDVEF